MNLASLMTERSNAASRAIDTLSTIDMLRVINDEDHRVAEAVAAELPSIAAAVDAIVARIQAGGRLFYIGAGTSGRLGVLDASECPPTFNVSYDLVQGIMAGGWEALYKATEASEDDPVAGVRDLGARGFTSADVLCGIAASGRTPYVLGAIRHARSIGAATVGISCTPDSELSAAVEFPIAPLPGPEVVTGSTRLKAGTATKLVLNMLTTGTMIRLGYVYGNLMVNVQPKNEKLVDRACRIIAEAANVDAAGARELFEASGRVVRTAIVMAKLGLDRASAEARLATAGGNIRRALGETR